MLRPSNRAWLKAVPYVLQRYFSFCVYGKLNLKMSTSKRRLDWMSPSSNNARFYIGNSVPLPSAPFPLSCRYLSLFQWLLLWIVKFIFFFFPEELPPSAALDPGSAPAWVLAAWSILPGGVLYLLHRPTMVSFSGELSGDLVSGGVSFPVC